MSQHALATKQPLHAFIEYKEGARDVDVRQLFIEKSIVGKQYAKDAQILIDYLNNLDETEQVDLETSLKSKGYFSNSFKFLLSKLTILSI